MEIPNHCFGGPSLPRGIAVVVCRNTAARWSGPASDSAGRDVDEMIEEGAKIIFFNMNDALRIEVL